MTTDSTARKPCLQSAPNSVRRRAARLSLCSDDCCEDLFLIGLTLFVDELGA